MPRGSNHPSICLGADQVSEAFSGLDAVCSLLPLPAPRHALQTPDTAPINALSSVKGIFVPQALIIICYFVIGDVSGGPVEQQVSPGLRLRCEDPSCPLS